MLIGDIGQLKLVYLDENWLRTRPPGFTGFIVDKGGEVFEYVDGVESEESCQVGAAGENAAPIVMAMNLHTMYDRYRDRPELGPIFMVAIMGLNK